MCWSGCATQGGLIEQSAQFYLTGVQTPNSVATRRAHPAGTEPGARRRLPTPIHFV